ncbi:MAG: TonB-dependent receptor [Bryobacteraceae bacterium]
MEGYLRILTILVAAACQAQVRFQGQVLGPTRAPLAGSRLLIARAGTVEKTAFTDVHGRFSISPISPGDYAITVEHPGYFPIRDRALRVEPDGEDAIFTLEPVREVTTSVDVNSAPVSVDMETAASKQGVSGAEIVNIPYPNTNDLRSALRIVPGVVRDRRGGVHVNGAGEDQVLYTLNGFNVSDPLTGRFESRLSVESIQAVEVVTGNVPAEFGKGSAGTLAIRTISGDDKLRHSATNFIPGVENRKGLIIGDWTPRANISGPLARGRAWISDSVDVQYVNTVIRDLPKGEDRGSSWRASNLVHSQVNLTRSNILYASFLLGLWRAAKTGLGALDPAETTVDRRSRQWFFNIKDQMYLGRSGIIEFGYASNRTFGREIPQGSQPLLITPFGRHGNYYVDAARKASRDQVIANAFVPSFEWHGAHQLKSGMDLNRIGYWQDVRRTGFENFDDTGLLVRKTQFEGSGLLRRGNYEASVYAQDSWRVRPSLLAELGLRGTWDHLLARWDPSPRAGLAWSPPRLHDTKFFAGFGRLYDSTNLRIFTRQLDQYSITSYFDPVVQDVIKISLARFRISNPLLSRPRYYNWTAGVEHHIVSKGLSLRAELMHRRGVRGFAYLPQIDDSYELTNFRTDAYDSAVFTMRHNFKKQYQWMASYTWSRALSNAVVDLSVEDPIVLQNNRGRMPWDAPHRFLSWGYLPTPLRNWAVAYLVDSRTGFPFSVQSLDGTVLGGVNSMRFPVYVEVNLHLERRFEFRGHLWAFRFGANNLTGRINPDGVYNVVGSPRFLAFTGGNGRSSNFRIRWLGKAR